MPRLLVVLLLAALPAAAAPRKIAVRALASGEGVSAKVGETLAETVAAELRRLPGLQISTQQEIVATLSLEQQKQLLACDDATCAADFGGALGVEALVTGTVARLGESWLVGLKLIDVVQVKVLAQSDRRLRNGTVDDVLDVLPAMARELVAAPPPEAKDVASAPVGITAAPATAEEPSALEGRKGRLLVLTDGKGRFVAYDPVRESFDPFWSGTAEKLFAQRVSGGSSEGNVAFDMVFWEPRAKARWQAGFGMRDNAYFLQCGDNKITLLPLDEPSRQRFLEKAAFFEPRWRRQAWLLAKDDVGDYWYADRLREPKGEASDWRLFAGPKGKLAPVPLTDVSADSDGELFVTPKGRLRRSGNVVEWIDPVTRQKTPFKDMPIESNAAFAYGQLGVYAQEQLGSACDGRF